MCCVPSGCMKGRSVWLQPLELVQTLQVRGHRPQQDCLTSDTSRSSGVPSQPHL